MTVQLPPDNIFTRHWFIHELFWNLSPLVILDEDAGNRTSNSIPYTTPSDDSTPDINYAVSATSALAATTPGPGYATITPTTDPYVSPSTYYHHFL